MGTQVERSSAEKDLAVRGGGYAMPHYHVDGNDVDTVIIEMGKAMERARRGDGPTYIVADTYRHRGHSMSDPMKYRKNKTGEWLPEVEEWRKRDPISVYSHRLREKGLLNDKQAETIDEAVAEEVNEAFAQADADPNPPLEARFEDALAETYPYQPK
jgi:TPP-dependent pyruvate/acetoin dehydrogenase alpha subunit